MRRKHDGIATKFIAAHERAQYVLDGLYAMRARNMIPTETQSIIVRRIGMPQMAQSQRDNIAGAQLILAVIVYGRTPLTMPHFHF